MYSYIFKTSLILGLSCISDFLPSNVMTSIANISGGHHVPSSQSSILDNHLLVSRYHQCLLCNLAELPDRPLPLSFGCPKRLGACPIQLQCKDFKIKIGNHLKILCQSFPPTL